MRACLRRSHVRREHVWIASFARHANGQTSAERTPASLMPRVHGGRRRSTEPKQQLSSAGRLDPEPRAFGTLGNRCGQQSRPRAARVEAFRRDVRRSQYGLFYPGMNVTDKRGVEPIHRAQRRPDGCGRPRAGCPSRPAPRWTRGLSDARVRSALVWPFACRANEGDPFVFAPHVRAPKARPHRFWRPLLADAAAIRPVFAALAAFAAAVSRDCQSAGSCAGGSRRRPGAAGRSSDRGRAPSRPTAPPSPPCAESRTGP